MPERILLLSWSVPPETNGSAIIVGNLAKGFSRSEMVVAGEWPYQRPPVQWEEEWPEIIYLTKGWPQRRRGARWWRHLQFPILFMRCVRLIRKYHCKAIIAVHPKEDFLLAGYLTALVTGAKLYLYFHNTYVEQCRRNSLHRHFAGWMQSKMFTMAQHVFVMSEGLADLFREKYRDAKYSPLVHSFNEPIPHFCPPPEPKTPRSLVVSGSINESCRDATVRVSSAISQLDDTSLTILS